MLTLAFAMPALSYQNDDPIRKAPPVRISMSALYQQWTHNDLNLHELSVPISAQLNFRPNFGVTLGVSQASAGGDNLTDINGLTDVHVGLEYIFQLPKAKVSINLGLKAPTGTSLFSIADYATALQIGASQYNFQVPHFGQGASIAPGVAVAASVSRTIALSAGLSFRLRNSFEPVSDLPQSYQWGNELLATAGVIGQLSRTLTLSADATYTRYAPDEIGSAIVYEAGAQITAQLLLHKRLRANNLWLGFRYRSVDINRVLNNGLLLPASVKSLSGLYNVTGSYQARLNDRFKTGLFAEATLYEADVLFDELSVFTLGVSPEANLSPGIAVPMRLQYSFGDLTGFQAGLGLTAIF